VAEIGCGHGASTILLAKAYPHSQFVGFDYHAPSMRTSRLNSARLQQSKSARIHSEAVAPERAVRVGSSPIASLILVNPLRLYWLHIWWGAYRTYLRMRSVLQDHNELEGLILIHNRDV
jgi:hypothetical protein